jgi:hypothetical protein
MATLAVIADTHLPRGSRELRRLPYGEDTTDCH